MDFAEIVREVARGTMPNPYVFEKLRPPEIFTSGVWTHVQIMPTLQVHAYYDKTGVRFEYRGRAITLSPSLIFELSHDRVVGILEWLMEET